MPQMGVDYDLNEYDTGPRHARAGLCSRGLLSCLTGRRPGPMRGQNHHCGVSADAHHPVACGACAAWSWSVQARTLSTCGAAAFVPCRIARPPQHSIECALRDARAHISGALQPSACAACDGVARGQDGRLPLSGGGPMPGLPVLVGDAILFLGAFLNADRSLWARIGDAAIAPDAAAFLACLDSGRWRIRLWTGLVFFMARVRLRYGAAACRHPCGHAPLAAMPGRRVCNAAPPGVLPRWGQTTLRAIEYEPP